MKEPSESRLVSRLLRARLFAPSSAIPLIGAGLMALVSTPSHAKNLTWTGGGVNNSWYSANWTGGSFAQNDNPRFELAGSGTSVTIATNTVDQNTSILNLTYQYSSPTNYHVTAINSGVKLTVGAALTVGSLTSGDITNVAFIGDGSFELTSAAQTILIGNRGGVNAMAQLDLSGLANFQATASSFAIGTGDRSGSLSLAKNSTLTTPTIYVGNSTASGGSDLPSELKLGAESVINATNFYIGSGVDGRQTSGGSVRFQTPGTGAVPQTTIRGAGGVGTKANLSIGRGEGLRVVTGIADFTLGKIDATLGTLEIAIGQSTGSGSSTTGVFKMAGGTVTADTVFLGSSEGSTNTLTTGTLEIGQSAGATTLFTAGSLSMGNNLGGIERVQSTLNISGGTVSITGTLADSSTALQVGAKAGTATSVIATINLTGGLLDVSSGNIAEGAGGSGVTSSITLDGGAINLHGHSLTVDSLIVKKGTLTNLGSLTTGTATGITKQNDGSGNGGTLTLAGTNTYTGATLVQAGTLIVNGSLTQSAVTVQNGATLAGSGNIASSVTINSGGSLAPGNSPGILQAGSLNVASGGKMSFELNGAVAGSGYDQVHVTGGVISLDGADLVLTLGFVPLSGQAFTLLKNDGGEAIVGQIATINGLTLTGNSFSLDFGGHSYDFTLSYTGEGASMTGGNDLVLQFAVVPEPGMPILLALAGGTTLLLRRRRKPSHSL